MAAARINDGELVNQAGLSRKHIFDAVEASVKRLGTYIDVLQIHRLDHDTPKEEIMKALNDVVEKGWVRYIGASSVSAYASAILITMLTSPQMAAWEFQQLQNVAKEHGWHQFVSMQNYYNLLYREEEREMIPYCRDAGVGLIPVCYMRVSGFAFAVLLIVPHSGLRLPEALSLGHGTIATLSATRPTTFSKC